MKDKQEPIVPALSLGKPFPVGKLTPEKLAEKIRKNLPKLFLSHWAIFKIQQMIKTDFQVAKFWGILLFCSITGKGVRGRFDKCYEINYYLN